MGQYDEGLVTAVAKAMQSSKAWPVVFQADAATELSRAAIDAVMEWLEEQRRIDDEIFNSDTPPLRIVR